MKPDTESYHTTRLGQDLSAKLPNGVFRTSMYFFDAVRSIDVLDGAFKEVRLNESASKPPV